MGSVGDVVSVGKTSMELCSDDFPVLGAGLNGGSVN